MCELSNLLTYFRAIFCSRSVTPVFKLAMMYWWYGRREFVTAFTNSYFAYVHTPMESSRKFLTNVNLRNRQNMYKKRKKMIWIKLFWTFRKQLFSSSTWFNELKAIVFETSKMVSFEPLLNFCILAACTTCKALFIYPFSNTHVPLRSSSLKEVTNIGVAGGGQKGHAPQNFWKI